MNVLPRLSLFLSFFIGLVACDGTQAPGAGTSAQGDDSDSGYLVIAPTHASLTDDEMIFFRSAQARTDRHELTVDSMLLQQDQLDSGRTLFRYQGIPGNVNRPFEIKFYGSYNNEPVELLSATGTHTFKTYQPVVCRPSRADDCSNEQQSDLTSESTQQLLEFTAIQLAYCDDDEVDNLTEIYFNTDPCGDVTAPPVESITSVSLLQPSENAVVERSSDYTFSFSATADSTHTDYLVRIFLGTTQETLIGTSTYTPVTGEENAQYSISMNINLSAGENYNWRVDGLTPENDFRTLSSARVFSVANVVPVLSDTLPINNAVQEFASADTGHLFRFNSSTDDGVKEYRVHLVDESNRIDYGYKRIPSNNNTAGSGYATTRNLALRQSALHRWTVTANSASGDILAQTPVREFSIQSLNYSLNLSAPAEAEQIDKVDSTVGYNFSFSSGTNTGIAQYRVYLRDTTNNIDYDYKIVAVGNSSNYSTTRNLDLAVNANHVWYVTANSEDGGELLKSEERPFRINSNRTTTALDISDPRNSSVREFLDASTGHVFYFNSSSDVGVSQYRVYVKETGGTDYSYKNVPARGDVAGGDYATTRNLAFNAGQDHVFYITANDADGNVLASSKQQSFSIEAPVPPVVEPLALTPLLPAANANIPWNSQSIGYAFEFSAENDDEVETYRVHVVDLDTPLDFSYKEIDAAASTTNGVVRTTRNINTNSNALHEWYVTAHDNAGTVIGQTDSQQFMLTVPTLTAGSPFDGETIALSETGYDFSFSSSSNDGVAEYRVYIVDITNNNSSFDYKSQMPNANGGSQTYTVTRNVSLQEDAEHSWRVSAVDAAGFEMSSSATILFNTGP